MDWAGWALFGLMATAALTAVMIAAQLAGLTRLEARAQLRHTGEPAAVVFRSGRPVGVVTAAALASTHDANALVATVMTMRRCRSTYPPTPRDTVRTFTRAAQDWLRQRPAA